MSWAGGTRSAHLIESLTQGRCGPDTPKGDNLESHYKGPDH